MILDIAQNIELEVFNASEYVFRQGSQGDKFYILISGVLLGLLEPPNMLTNNAKILEQSKVIFKVEPGDHFGELALQNNASRSCSVQAEEMSICAVLKKDSFLKIVGEEGIKKKFKEIEEFLLKTKNFSSCNEEDVKTLSTKLSPISHQSGVVLVDQGEKSLRMYILRSGSLSVKKKILKDDTNEDLLPKILQPYFKKLPEILEVEVMNKSTPGDAILFYEIMQDINSRYKIEVSIPSKLYHCSVSDIFNIFKEKELLTLPLYEDSITDDDILVRRYLERELWKEYSSSFYSTTFMGLHQSKTNSRKPLLEDEKRKKILEEKTGILEKYLSRRVREINGDIPEGKKLKKKRFLVPVKSRIQPTLIEYEDSRAGSFQEIKQSTKNQGSISELKQSNILNEAAPVSLRSMPRDSNFSTKNKISARRFGGTQADQTFLGAKSGVLKLHNSSTRLLLGGDTRVDRTMMLSRLSLKKTKPPMDEFVSRIVGQHAIEIIATANGKAKGLIPETDREKKRLAEGMQIDLMEREIDQLCREKIPRPLPPIRSRSTERKTSNQTTTNNAGSMIETKIKNIAVKRVLNTVKFEDNKEKLKFLNYLASSRNNFYLKDTTEII